MENVKVLIRTFFLLERILAEGAKKCGDGQKLTPYLMEEIWTEYFHLGHAMGYDDKEIISQSTAKLPYGAESRDWSEFLAKHNKIQFCGAKNHDKA